MNLKKRMNYGSRGYYLPPIPHIPNKAKGKRTNRRKLVDNNPFGAFDLLATIAGKLLTGLENEPINNNGAPNCTQSKLDIVKKEPKTESSTNDSGIIVSNLNPTKTLIGESGTKQENNDINNNANNVDNDNNDGLVRSNSSNSSSEMPLYSGVNPNPNPNLFLEKRVYRDDNDENSTNKFKINNNLSAQKPFIAKLRKAASYNKTNDESNTKCYTRKRTQKRKSEFCSDGDLYKEVKKRSLSSSQKQQACANHVKLSIKSFKVPELLIEIPESATIATLKKVVMETVTAVLEGEIRVGVMVQGKAVRDDTRTLKQVGIYQNATGVIDALNFSLEPEHSAPHVSSQTQEEEEEEHIVEPLASIAPNTLQIPSQFETTNNMGTVPVSVPVPTTPVKSHVSDPDPTSPMEVTSQAIVPVVPVKEELVESVPAEPVRKWRHSEMMMLGQRRIRRPFSVGEVEALVSAVELLGTGRWRDVKIRSFDDAKHRTYVDLKDKWKTLVHTASIAPQQRRGEPVPQDLLDRVLLAQAHWAHQHSKMHARSSSFNAEPGLAIFDSSPVALESN